MATIKGLRDAVKDYQRFNAGGPYDPRYGMMMYDTNTGELWTDEFYSIGHNEWREYWSDTIYCVSEMMQERAALDGEKAEITMASVTAFIEEAF